MLATQPPALGDIRYSRESSQEETPRLFPYSMHLIKQKPTDPGRKGRGISQSHQQSSLHEAHGDHKGIRHFRSSYPIFNPNYPFCKQVRSPPPCSPSAPSRLGIVFEVFVRSLFLNFTPLSKSCHVF